MKYRNSWGVWTLLLAALSLAAAGPARAQEKAAPLTLEKAVATALLNNKEIHESGMDVRIAESRIDEADSVDGFKADLSANQMYTHDDAAFPYLSYPPVIVNDAAGQPTAVAGLPPDVQMVDISEDNSTAIDFSISRPLDPYRKIQTGVRMAREGREIAELQTELKRRDVALAARTGFFQMQLADRALAVATETLANAEEHLRAAQARYDAGAVPYFDVVRAKVEVETAREELTTMDKARALARMNLNNVLGIDIEAPTEVKPAEALAIKPLDSLQSYSDQALENRIELKLLDKQAKQIELNEIVDRSRPSFGVFGQYNILNEGGGAFGSENAWRIGLKATAPLFDNGEASAKIRRGRLNLEKLDTTKERARDGIRLEVQEAWLSVKEAAGRIETSDAILEQAEEAHRMAVIGFDVGAVPNLDLIDAQHQLSRAKLNLAKAYSDYQAAMAKLRHAAGIGEDDSMSMLIAPPADAPMWRAALPEAAG